MGAKLVKLYSRDLDCERVFEAAHAARLLSFKSGWEQPKKQVDDDKGSKRQTKEPKQDSNLAEG